MISGSPRTPVKTVSQVRDRQRDGDSAGQAGDTECLIALHRWDEIEEDERDHGDSEVVEHEQLPEWPSIHDVPFEGSAACLGCCSRCCSIYMIT